MNFINYSTPTEYNTLSLHDALPISRRGSSLHGPTRPPGRVAGDAGPPRQRQDRKSTRLNSSHLGTSYAVFWLKKKNIRLIWMYLDSNIMKNIVIYTLERKSPHLTNY